MFKGDVFLAAPDVPRDVRSLVAACGGCVVSRFDATVTLGLAVGSRQENIVSVRRLRGLRIPILRTSWVRASVAAGHLIPKKHPHVLYDPTLFESFCFTTTMLPMSIKPMVVAAIQFFGGTYSPNLTTATDIVLYGCYDRETGNASAEGASQQVMRSSKWRQACEHGIPCVHVSWLQDCISTAQRHALPGILPPTTTADTFLHNGTVACGGDHENIISGSSSEAAGGRRNHYPVGRPSCSRDCISGQISVCEETT